MNHLQTVGARTVTCDQLYYAEVPQILGVTGRPGTRDLCTPINVRPRLSACLTGVALLSMKTRCELNSLVFEPRWRESVVFSSLFPAQTGCLAYPSFCTKGRGGNAAGAWR